MNDKTLRVTQNSLLGLSLGAHHKITTNFTNKNVNNKKKNLLFHI